MPCSTSKKKLSPKIEDKIIKFQKNNIEKEKKYQNHIR